MRAIPAVAFLVLASFPAWADFTFISGTTTTGGATVGGKAVFHNAGGGVLDLTLSNTTSTLTDIGQLLDGLGFTLSGATITNLVSVTASNGTIGGGSGDFVDCTNGTCTSVSTFHNYDNNPDMFAGCDASGNCVSPYGWGLVGNTLGAGDKNGSLSWKPGAIVNSNLAAGSITNVQHNDYLMGPVTFVFDYTGTLTNISSVTFDWGTTPDTTAGTLCTDCGGGGGGGNTVPEPSSIVLLGTACLIGTSVLRKKFAARS